jgi:hypothetical protein
MKAAYQVVLDGCHPDADTIRLGKLLAEALNTVLDPLTVTVTKQWELPTEAERIAGQ